MRRLYCSLQAVRMSSLSAASLSTALSPPSVQRHCNAFLASPAVDPPARPTLILLNGPGSLEPICSRWHHFDAVICADGGANRLYDSLHLDPQRREQLVPTHIKGDLDSLRPEVARFYQQRGCQVVRDEDQDCNDLEKCLALVQEQQEEEQERQRKEGRDKEDKERQAEEGTAATPAEAGAAGRGKEVVVFGAFGGRFDQQMASINAIHKRSFGGSSHTDTANSGDAPSSSSAASSATQSASRGISRVLLLGEGNAATILRRGKHTLSLCPLEGPGCSLLPIGSPVVASTRGLQWDLDGTTLAFGGLVSTSNRVRDRGAGAGGLMEVEVVCDGDLVWCCDIDL